MSNPAVSLDSGGSPALQRFFLSLVFLAAQSAGLVWLTRPDPVPVPTPPREYTAGIVETGEFPNSLLPDPMDLILDHRHGFSRQAVQFLPKQEQPWLQPTVQIIDRISAPPADRISAPSGSQPVGNGAFQSPLVTEAVGRVPSSPISPISTCHFDRSLAGRWISETPPTWKGTDLLPPTSAHLFVLPDGRVLQAVLLKRSGVPAADALFLQWARTQKFKPSANFTRNASDPASPTIGTVEIHWAVGVDKLDR